MRFIDDYESAAETRSEAEAILHVLQEQLAQYELALNGSKTLWDSTANQVICEHLPIGHASESAWAIWLLKNLNCRLSPASARAIGTCNDSVASLMGLGLLEAGLGPTSGDDPRDGLSRFASAHELFEDRWLLCYEGVLRGWLGKPQAADLLRQEARFESLSTKNVSFFELDAPHPVPARGSTAGGGAGGAGY